MGRTPGVLVLVIAVVATELWQLSSAVSLATWSRHSHHPPPTSSAEVSIVGGQEVQRGEVPYLVSLNALQWTPTHPRYFCGGSIYDASTIVTAAHCLQPYQKNYYDIVVVAGEHNRSVLEGSEQVMEVKDIILHPEYDPLAYKNNIGIIKLTKQLHFNEYVQPMRLPTHGVSLPDECMVAGWGPKEEGGNAADVPYKVTLPLLSHDVCSKILEGDFDLAEHMVCAGLDEGGMDACESDYGSPLTCHGDSGSYQAALVSWQSGCARPLRPTVFTNLMYFTHWMKELKINSTHKPHC